MFITRDILIFKVKGMSSRSKPNYRFTSHKIIINVFHLIVRQSSKPCRNNHQVSTVKGFQAWDVFHIIGIYYTRVGRILCKQHGTVKSVVFGKDFSQLRHRFLRAVFFIPGNKDYVLCIFITTFKS